MLLGHNILLQFVLVLLLVFVVVFFLNRNYLHFHESSLSLHHLLCVTVVPSVAVFCIGLVVAAQKLCYFVQAY